MAGSLPANGCNLRATAVKQVLAGRGGQVRIAECPVPTADPFGVVIATEYSLISPGTERTALSRSGGTGALARRALSDPALRAKVIGRLQSKGVSGAFQEARLRASKPTALGYSAAGTVTAVGAEVSDIAVGDRVAAAGAGYASHAELIGVPRPLVTRVPERVSTRDAAFTTVGAIALHGFRLGGATIGDRVLVVGLGLVGQLTAQLAAAAGARVFGLDPVTARCERAQRLVPDGEFRPDHSELASSIAARSHDIGADLALITAGGGSGLVTACLPLLRDRARIVVVGGVDLTLDRDAMYEKEIEVVVSRSYGPGRYDINYEESGVDYPISYVRWTEGRNFEAVLDLMGRGRLSVDDLITAVVPIGEAQRAYDLIKNSDKHLGVLLSYPRVATSSHQPTIGAVATRVSTSSSRVRLALIGPGSFATSVLIPALREMEAASVVSVVAPRPPDAAAAAHLFADAEPTTDLDAALSRADVDAVVIATRHNSHATIVERSIRAGKHVFVEKPLGLTVGECERVVVAAEQASRLCMVDFNRRFSRHARLLRRELRSRAAGASAIYRVNAGHIPLDHWTRNQDIGGGRVVGEAVHFLDFLCWLFQSDPIGVSGDPRAVADPLNEAVCTLTFSNGQSGVLIYSARGGLTSSKETIEVHGGGHSWFLDDFRSTARDGRTLLKSKPDKGHAEALRNFVAAVMGRGPIGVTAAEGCRATRLALQVQGRFTPPSTSS